MAGGLEEVKRKRRKRRRRRREEEEEEEEREEDKGKGKSSQNTDHFILTVFEKGGICCKSWNIKADTACWWWWDFGRGIPRRWGKS